MKKAGTQRIETHRLILRRFVVEDAESMYANWASDPEVTRFLTWPPHPDASATRMLLTDWVSQYDDGGCFNWAIEWKESGSLIGSIAVVRTAEAIGEAEIGYCLSRAYWGQGIMPEALRAVTDYLFEQAEAERITAMHDSANPKSGRVMEKAGMKKEGVLRRAGRNNQGICDMVCYSLIRSDRKPVPRAETASVIVREAREGDLDRVNELRRQVNELHVTGKPEVFKPGFGEELQNYIHTIWKDPQQRIIVAELNGTVAGFAVLHHIIRPETPFMFERDFLDVDEFCTDERCRRRGIASAMIRYIRQFAAENGFHRIELNMWAFNHDALAFYEAAGFKTYRRYMEMGC